VYVLHDLAEAFREAQRIFVLHEGRAALVRPDDPQRRSKLAAAFEVPQDRVPAV